jgi:hypothetical protein
MCRNNGPGHGTSRRWSDIWPEFLLRLDRNRGNSRLLDNSTMEREFSDSAGQVVSGQFDEARPVQAQQEAPTDHIPALRGWPTCGILRAVLSSPKGFRR